MNRNHNQQSFQNEPNLHSYPKGPPLRVYSMANELKLRSTITSESTESRFLSKKIAGASSSDFKIYGSAPLSDREGSQ
jgi:hypothetical protein